MNTHRLITAPTAANILGMHHGAEPVGAPRPPAGVSVYVVGGSQAKLHALLFDQDGIERPAQIATTTTASIYPKEIK